MAALLSEMLERQAGVVNTGLGSGRGHETYICKSGRAGHVAPTHEKNEHSFNG